MGIMVYSLLWVMQDFVHQPYLQEIDGVEVRNLPRQPEAAGCVLFCTWNVLGLRGLRGRPVGRAGYTRPHKPSSGVHKSVWRLF